MAGVYNIRPPRPKYTFIWDVNKVIDFLATLNSPRELSLKDLTLKLIMLLALTSAARASKIGFLDIRYLIKHSSGYTFHFGKNKKTFKRSKPRDPIKFVCQKNQSQRKENQSLCVCRCIDLYLEGTKEMRGQNSQLLLGFVKPHGAVSTPTISRWIMIVLNLSGINTKTFTGHSTKTASSSKAKEAGVPTGEILKRGFWSKESTFEKFYHQGINREDPHFQLSILKSFEERSSKQ